MLMGFRHALEADHVMATLAINADSGRSRAIVQGVVWGIGHTITLLVVGIIFLSTNTLIPNQVASFLELSFGAMLIVLGIDLLRRLLKRRIQTGAHQHLAGATEILRHRHDCARGYDLAARPFRF